MNVNTFLDYYPGWVVGWMGGLTLTIKLISVQLSYAAAVTGLSLTKSGLEFLEISFKL